MNHGDSAYGLWGLVFLNSAVFIVFALSFFKPATARDWRTFGMYGRLAIAEETEMRAEFAADFDRYAAVTPRFIPGFTRPTPAR